jgi:hypothetical protein
MKLTLAERMFEGVFDEQSDRNLNQMRNEIKELKEKYGMTFRSLIKTPFIKQMFEMIEDEYEYRNQMMEENNR